MSLYNRKLLGDPFTTCEDPNETLLNHYGMFLMIAIPDSIYQIRVKNQYKQYMKEKIVYLNVL